MILVFLIFKSGSKSLNRLRLKLTRFDFNCIFVAYGEYIHMNMSLNQFSTEKYFTAPEYLTSMSDG